jgi:hypothetical protein
MRAAGENDAGREIPERAIFCRSSILLGTIEKCLGYSSSQHNTQQKKICSLVAWKPPALGSLITLSFVIHSTNDLTKCWAFLYWNYEYMGKPNFLAKMLNETNGQFQKKKKDTFGIIRHVGEG